jgi:hypothetical protein
MNKLEWFFTSIVAAMILTFAFRIDSHHKRLEALEAQSKRMEILETRQSEHTDLITNAICATARGEVQFQDFRTECDASLQNVATVLERQRDLLTNAVTAIRDNKTDTETVMNAIVGAMARMDVVQKQLYTNQLELARRLEIRGGAR